MKKIIKTKNIELSKSIEDYLDKKIQSLEKFLKSFNQDLITAAVEIGQTRRGQQSGDIFRAEINLNLGGKLLRAEAEAINIFAAIDEVRDDLEREIKKYKEKKDTIFIRGARSIKKKFSISPLARFKE